MIDYVIARASSSLRTSFTKTPIYFVYSARCINVKYITFVIWSFSYKLLKNKLYRKVYEMTLIDLVIGSKNKLNSLYIW